MDPSGAGPGSARVVVVGAGLAGLAAAATLGQAGFQDVRVLEATERAGGRINTTRPFGGDTIELGASWIHGREGNPLYILAERRGLLSEDAGAGAMCLPSSVTPRDYFFREDGRRLPPGDVRRVCSLFSQLTSRVFDRKLEERHRPHSLGSYLDEAFAESALASSCGDAAQIFEWCKRSECTDEACSSLYQVSASQLGHYVALEGGYFNSLGPGGYQSVADVLLRSLPPGALVCDAPVTRIHWGLSEEARPVRVLCEDGQAYESDHVIVTVSLGLLKERASAMFVPSLPRAKADAISRLGFGTVDKIFLWFGERFWPEDCTGIQLVWEEGPEDEVIYRELSAGDAWRKTWHKKICGFDVVAGHPSTLCGWITGREAQYMESLEETTVGEVCVRLLRAFTPWPVPEPTQVLASRWWRHPYVRGSYTFIPPGLDAKEEQEALAAPLPSDACGSETKPLQVLFAGEATHVNFYTTAHGAYLTGLREAQRVIDLYAEKRSSSQVENSLEG